MDSEWRILTLREANVSLIDCDHRTPPATESGYPYVAIPQLKDGRIDLSQVRRISREDYVKWTLKANPVANDVILSRRCNPGETAVVPPSLQFALGQNLVLLRADGTEVYPPFLRWLVRGPEWWEQVRKYMNVGAVFDSLKCADVPDFELTFPPFPEQHAIAHVLGTLDDKIDINRRMNKTLESIARAIFKSWFIDFEPIPGLGPHKEWEDSVLGKIPKGWRWTVLGEVAGINRLCTSRDLRGVIEYVDISSVSVGRLNGTNQYSTQSAPSRAKRLVRHGDTLWSCVRPNRRSYLFVHRPPQNMVVSTGFAVLSPEKVPSSYLYLWVTQEQFVDYLTTNADGSAYPAVRPEHFERAEFLLPTSEDANEFHRVVGPMIDKIFVNDRDSDVLSSVRDALLPRLLSGEIRIKDAEKIVSQAV